MRAIDTNVLVRLVTRDEPRQMARAEAFVAPGAWVSHLVLMETTWVLSAIYALEAHKISTIIEMLLRHQNLTLQDPDVVAAALDQFRRKPSLGFSDCLILEVARAAGHVPLGTLDRRLGRLNGTQHL